MNQEYQVLVVLDLLVTQMNKFASRKLKPYGIKFNELNIIRFIEKADGPVYQKTICQEFQLSHSTVVGIVFRLDDLGYLLIGNSRVDKRHTNVTITEKGKQLIQETEDIYQEIIGKMKVIISDEEMSTIIQSVDQIKELFKQEVIMGTFKFSMRMLVKDYKKSLFYGITLIFAVAVCFVFFNIINNTDLADQTIAKSGGTWNDVQMPFSSVLSFLIICFCCFMIFFANNFFLSRKTTELAIMAMSGSGYINSTMYVLYQTFTLLLLATPLGILIGRGVVPFSNAYMYQMLGVHKDPSIIPSEAYIYSFVLVAIVLSMICVLTAGFLHKNDIQTLLSQEKEMKVKRNTKKSVSITFIAIYILGIVMMFMNPHEATAYIVPTLVGLGGAVGMIRYVLPDVVRNLKRGVFLTKRYVLISISNLNY